MSNILNPHFFCHHVCMHYWYNYIITFSIILLRLIGFYIFWTIMIFSVVKKFVSCSSNFAILGPVRNCFYLACAVFYTKQPPLEINDNQFTSLSRFLTDKTQQPSYTST